MLTPRGALWARNVVIASGSLNHPRRPAATSVLPSHLVQMDASDYRNPAALPADAVLVVGSAQCGGQIAEDLVQANRMVFLATGRVGRMPRRYRGRDIVFWLRRSGLFDVPRRDFLDPSGCMGIASAKPKWTRSPASINPTFRPGGSCMEGGRRWLGWTRSSRTLPMALIWWMAHGVTGPPTMPSPVADR